MSRSTTSRSVDSTIRFGERIAPQNSVSTARHSNRNRNERSASTTSQHLRVLREGGIVSSERRGNVVRYRLADGITPDLLAQVAMRLDAV